VGALFILFSSNGLADEILDIRLSPDALQIRGNCNTVPPPRELYPLPQPSDGTVLVIGPRLEDHSVIFLAIQTHPSCRFLRAVDSLGLRRSGSSSQFIDPPQDFPKQVPRHGDFGQLARDVPAMADNFGAELDHP